MEQTEAQVAPEAAPVNNHAIIRIANGRNTRKRRNRKRNRGKSLKYHASSPESRVRATSAVKQIEYYFTTENLAQDAFLRCNMDAEGFVPVAIVANFPRVARLRAAYPDLLDALAGESEVLELDAPNETMRLRDRPHRWVFPNPPPRWIKQEVATEDDNEARANLIADEEEERGRKSSSSNSSGGGDGDDDASCGDRRGIDRMMLLRLGLGSANAPRGTHIHGEGQSGKSGSAAFAAEGHEGGNAARSRNGGNPDRSESSPPSVQGGGQSSSSSSRSGDGSGMTDASDRSPSLADAADEVEEDGARRLSSGLSNSVTSNENASGATSHDGSSEDTDGAGYPEETLLSKGAATGWPSKRAGGRRAPTGPSSSSSSSSSTSCHDDGPLPKASTRDPSNPWGVATSSSRQAAVKAAAAPPAAKVVVGAGASGGDPTPSGAGPAAPAPAPTPPPSNSKSPSSSPAATAAALRPRRGWEAAGTPMPAPRAIEPKAPAIASPGSKQQQRTHSKAQAAKPTASSSFAGYKIAPAASSSAFGKPTWWAVSAVAEEEKHTGGASPTSPPSFSVMDFPSLP